MKLPDENPKTRLGVQKDPMHFIPTTALRPLGRVMRNGAEKYGPYNWRDSGITLSVYYDAAMRHLMALWEGEDVDPESGEPHQAHVMACMAILMDAEMAGKLNDDRPVSGAETPSHEAIDPSRRETPQTTQQ